ncbi:alkaline phosphatase [Salmonella enterica subsp. enterica serovar Newport]|uniref:DeoR/GlpR family DNA-binding transcription regulator n=1 Tax=Salmonella enterica TaxID=28901 RepID=UPI000D57C4EB|nr:DeoR/GlpR family DNA-binding transcription regulator [Salmonella enterica]EIN0285745.1 DeoR/GlpR transcriptional regulator [Salmonella enterica]EJW9984619.1 DeoR/GlpR transcriptional regulator [Salmonella enterica]ELG9347155.1 DeoR/GlpR transcriptional regulator [Salmonella enterica]PVJ97475.1 alkaline phosphatase [Salmonella enterica subsp. enterica serovar Newport]
MIPQERYEFICRHVDENFSASIALLASLLNVSHMTVRRDIQHLEKNGQLKIVSGGVVSTRVLKEEDLYTDKMSVNAGLKNKIAISAAAIITDGMTVFLDAGTSMLQLAKKLSDKSDMTVITNDFSICHFLMKNSAATLYHTGGLVDKRNFSSVGMHTANFIKTFNIDVAFISTSSWDKNGISTPYEGKALVKKAVIEVSEKNILLADSSKYGKKGLYAVCGLNVFDTIITDNGIPPSEFEKIKIQSKKYKIINV